MEVGCCAGAKHLIQKRSFFSANQMGERSPVLLFRASNKSDFLFSQSGVLLFSRLLQKIYKVFSGPLVIPDWNHAASGDLYRERRTNPDLPPQT
jgi:hypothetical protein